MCSEAVVANFKVTVNTPKILRENNLCFRQRCEPNTSRRLTASPTLLGMW